MAGDFEPKMPDPAESMKARNTKFLHGWTVEKWIEFVQRNPECTLPGGVGAAILKYFAGEILGKNLVVMVATNEFVEDTQEWSEPVEVKTERTGVFGAQFRFRKVEFAHGEPVRVRDPLA